VRATPGPPLQLGLLLRSAGDLGEHQHAGTSRQPLERGADGRQRALVTGEQVPVGGGVRRVAAARPHQLDPVAGPGRRGPRAGQPLVPVEHEVDGQLADVGVPRPHRVRAGHRPHQGLLRQWSPEDAGAVERALRAADLQDLAERPLDSLSGGQRQRAWIAMVVAQETGVVLLDEPTSALDLGHQLEVLELVSDLAASGRTVVLVLHDLSTACRHADHLVAMRAGAIVAEGRPADIVTPGLVRDLYGVEAVVLGDPATGTPVICSVRRVPGPRG
jgi:ABC transporter family protein